MLLYFLVHDTEVFDLKNTTQCQHRESHVKYLEPAYYTGRHTHDFWINPTRVIDSERQRSCTTVSWPHTAVVHIRARKSYNINLIRYQWNIFSPYPCRVFNAILCSAIYTRGRLFAPADYELNDCLSRSTLLYEFTVLYRMTDIMCPECRLEPSVAPFVRGDTSLSFWFSTCEPYGLSSLYNVW